MVGGEGFLIDTSAISRIMLPAPSREWRDPLERGLVGMCAPGEVEALFSARSGLDYERRRTVYRALYTWWPMPDGVWSKAAELQEALVRAGVHRSVGLADLLLAATAKHHRLTVLHYDRDFETIGKVTGQPTRWLAEPGSID